MPEATAPATTQGDAADDAQGASGTPPQGGTPAPAHGAEGDQGTATVEALTRKVQELERDNRSYRKREKDREDAERTKAEADMTEVEKLRAENERLAQSLQEREARERRQSLQMSALQEAQRLGFRDPEDAVTIVSAKAEAVEWDKDGTPRNVGALLQEYAKTRPHLVVSTDFGGGPRGQSATSGAPDMNALIRGAAGAKSR
jgi:hypothetical protein